MIILEGEYADIYEGSDVYTWIRERSMKVRKALTSIIEINDDDDDDDDDVEDDKENSADAVSRLIAEKTLGMDNKAKKMSLLI